MTLCLYAFIDVDHHVRRVFALGLKKEKNVCVQQMDNASRLRILPQFCITLFCMVRGGRRQRFATASHSVSRAWSTTHGVKGVT